MAQKPPIQPTPRRGRPTQLQGALQRPLLAVRVPEEMLHRLETYMVRVQVAHPYLKLSRAAVIRTLLDKGLSAEGA